MLPLIAYKFMRNTVSLMMVCDASLGHAKPMYTGQVNAETVREEMARHCPPYDTDNNIMWGTAPAPV